MRNTLKSALVGLLIWSGLGHVVPPLPASADERDYLDRVSRQVGWGGERLAFEASRDAPRFLLQGAARDNAKRRVVLWDVVKWVQGRHLVTRRQEIGDCVGFGAAQAVDYLQFVQVVLYGRNETPKRVWVPYHYATGRNAPECGAGRIRGPDGSIGSWQSKALQLYGVIAEDFDGLPAYSASVARQYATRMPPQRLIDEGVKHVVKSIALVKTIDEARDAICNGYPLTIASSWGGLMKPPTVDGKLVNKRSTRWMHQMCVIGYDGTGAQPLFYVLNSWGPTAHGAPPDDSPPGGFWIGVADLKFILDQSDTWALSDLDAGFESRELDVSGLTRIYWKGKTYVLLQPSGFDPGAGDRLDAGRDRPTVDGARTRSGARTLIVRPDPLDANRDVMRRRSLRSAGGSEE